MATQTIEFSIKTKTPQYFHVISRHRQITIQSLKFNIDPQGTNHHWWRDLSFSGMVLGGLQQHRNGSIFGAAAGLDTVQQHKQQQQARPEFSCFWTVISRSELDSHCLSEPILFSGVGGRGGSPKMSFCGMCVWVCFHYDFLMCQQLDTNIQYAVVNEYTGLLRTCMYCTWVCFL